MKAAPTIATLKIKMMKESMQCFAYGLFSFVPVLGFPFAIAALWLSGKVRVKEKQLWNPARPYRDIGVICATFTSVIWFIVIAMMIYHWTADNSGGGGIDYYSHE